MRIHAISLDEHSDNLLKNLARDFGGNKSMVTRYALNIFNQFIKARKQGGELFSRTRDGKETALILLG